MKIRIAIDKVTALKAGRDKYGPVVVEVPAETLSPEHRDELAQQTWSSSNTTMPADFYLDVGDYTVRNAADGIAEASPDAVKLILDRLIEFRRRKTAEAAAQEQQRAATLAAEVAECRRQFKAEPHSVIEDDYGTFRPRGLLRRDIPDLADVQKWAEAQCSRLNEERKLAKLREAEEEKAMKAAGQAKLREWVDANGSDLLKARLADGFEWLGLAEREFANIVVTTLGAKIDIPDYKDQKESERTTPTMEEIVRLRNVRQAIKGQPAEAKLVWSEYKIAAEDEYGETNDEEKIKRAEVKVTVTCPTGRTLNYYYGIDEPAKCGCTATVRCDLHKAI